MYINIVLTTGDVTMDAMKHFARATVLLCGIAATGLAQAAENDCGITHPIPDGGQEFKNTGDVDRAIQRGDSPPFRVLDVGMAKNTIAGCEVNLRSYNGALTGGTLRVDPGGTLRVLVTNSLDKNPPNPDGNPNVPPHMPNTTNFHAHGFHVSPDGISDNVLRLMPPEAQDNEDKYQYIPYMNPTRPGEYPVVIEVPENHPAGTFWYHAHIHGSTAMQVSSGMAGALIVPGGLDNVPEIKAAEAQEKIMLFQQIAYDENGEINDYSTLGGRWWGDSNRRTTINGQIAPIIRMRPGEMQRWRMIHGGINETLHVQLQGHVLHEIAVDGLATGRCDSWYSVTMYPGYRSDVLVKASLTKGEYLVMDGTTGPSVSLLKDEEDPVVLAKVIVDGEPMEARLPCAPGELAAYKAIPDITAQEYDEKKGATQDVQLGFNNDGFGAVNGIAYDASDPPRELALGTIGKWRLTTGGHPFHIHVNPFQTVRPGPDGVEQTLWRDTYFTGTQAVVEIMSRYEVFTGTFVLHCHILDHEDKGMMQQVRIK